MSKISLIKEIAENLVENKTTMTYDQLAKYLNDTGYKTTYGTKYTGKRGVARLISTVFNKLLKSGDKNATEAISKAFTNKSGNYPWD